MNDGGIKQSYKFIATSNYNLFFVLILVIFFKNCL